MAPIEAPSIEYDWAPPTAVGRPPKPPPKSPLVGVFGRYASLTIHFPLAAVGKRVLAQDLLSDGPPTDVTAQVAISHRQGSGVALRIPGALIDTVGTAARSNPKDVSDPGLVLSVQ